MPPGSCWYILLGIAAVLLLAFIILTMLSVRTAKKLFHLVIPWHQSGGPLMLGMLLAVVSLALRRLPDTSHVLPALLAVTATSALFLVVSNRLGSAWLPFFPRLAFPAGAVSAAVLGGERGGDRQEHPASEVAVELESVTSSWASGEGAK